MLWIILQFKILFKYSKNFATHFEFLYAPQMGHNSFFGNTALWGCA